MRPTLAVIPQLPAAWLLPLIGLSFLLALALSARAFVARPALGAENGPQAQPLPIAASLNALLVAAGVSAVLWLWSTRAITLHSYGFFLIIGFFLAVWSGALEAKRRGHDPNLVLDLALPMLLVTVVMCRIVYIVLDWNSFDSWQQMLQVWSGGLSFHGALIGAFMVCGFFAWKWKMHLTTLGDIIAPCVFLGYAFGRIGCLFNGCCYGGVCSPSLPWAMRFADEHHPGQLTPPSHPAQLYSALLAFALFGFMQWAKKQPYFNRFSGNVMLLFLGLYAVERAIIEVFREGATATTVFGSSWMTQAQLLSFVSLAVIAVAWNIMAHRARRVPSTVALTPDHVSAG